MPESVAEFHKYHATVYPVIRALAQSPSDDWRVDIVIDSAREHRQLEINEIVIDEDNKTVSLVSWAPIS